MWSLYENNQNQFLKPLAFSNGKTQEDVVMEVIKAIEENHKVIFIKGVCGTGKSAIALNLAKELGKASVVVPVKALQKQYEDDYTNKKYLLKNNGQKLKIKVITGRANFTCPFLQENKIPSDLNLTEGNSKLSDFFAVVSKKLESYKKQAEKQNNSDSSCNNLQLPCKIEIKDKNIKNIKKYLKMNPKVKSSDFVFVNKVKRLSIAPVCPYWSPIVPSEIDFGILDDAHRQDYIGLKGRKYTIYQRKQGCGYYDQYQAYINSDVLIFNSQKYKLETVMDRKPATDVEIIDECDEFLDSFSNQEKINLDKLNFALGSLFTDDDKSYKIIDEMIKITSEILKDKKIEQSILNEDIIPVKDTKIIDVLQRFLESDFMSSVECDEENYCYHCDEVARTFRDFLDETYISFHKEEKSLMVNLVTTNLEKKFKELLHKNKVLVMMSGTIHSKEVLRDIFGITDFKIIEAETKMPGKISDLRTGLEINCKYDNFQKGKISREQYLSALQKCIKQAKKPVLIHVNSFKDLPSEEELEKHNLEIMTREKLKQLQGEDSTGEAIKKFKEGEIEILYSTKCNRGADFPGETCNSIILTKYPYPNVNSLFWKVLKRTMPQHYSSFYMDKSRREFLQRTYRGLRSESDRIYLLSPDIRIFNNYI